MASPSVGIDGVGVGDRGRGQRLIGIKVEVSPEVGVPGGSASDSKLFIMVPPQVSTVRELKRHLVTSILKTRTPFYFSNGDYKIPDDEDVRIFTLIPEPCRILPVRPVKSSMSTSLMISPVPTTGDVNYDTSSATTGTSDMPKRVKFSDEISIRIPTSSKHTNDLTSVDQLDGIGGTFCQQNALENGGIENKTETKDKERKKRKRKRKKGKKKAGDDKKNEESEEEDILDGFILGKPVHTDLASPAASSSTLVDVGSTAKVVNKSKKRKKGKTVQFLNYDADESGLEPSLPTIICQSDSPTTHLTVASSSSPSKTTPVLQPTMMKASSDGRSTKKVEFVSPNTVFSANPYRPLKRNSGGCSDNPSFSSFSSSGYGTPTATSTGKRRQDTPMLPRVLKNPCTAYELVKKRLNVQMDQAVEVGEDEYEMDTVPAFTQQSDPVVRNGLPETQLKSNSNGQDVEKSKTDITRNYNDLPIIKMPDFINVGDVLAFKVLEMDEKFQPGISDFKEAKVVTKNDSILGFEYLKNSKKERTGIYELQDEDIPAEDLDDQTERDFFQLIEPKLIHMFLID